MKYSSKFALTSLLFVNCSAFAATPADGWYAGLMGGVSYSPAVNALVPDPVPLNNLNITVNPLIHNRPRIPVTTLMNFPFNILSTSGLINGSVSHGIGGDGGGQVGYRICNFRFEGELFFNYAPFSQMQADGIITKRHVTHTNPIYLNGQTTLGAGLFNAYYDFYDEDNDPSFIPYLGLGIGYSYVRNTINFTVPYLFIDTVSFNTQESKSLPVGQLIIGLSYYYSDNLAFGLDYRYVTTKASTNNTLEHLGFSSFNKRVQVNTINLNFNYWFED